MSKHMSTQEGMDIVFTCTSVSPDGKKLVPDKDGYYTLQGGALGVYNRNREFYPLDPRSIKLFEADSDIAVKAAEGALHAEWDHPVRPVGMTDADWLERNLEVSMDRTCLHIRKIRLVNDTQDGRPVKRIYLEVKPQGVFKAEALDALENRFSNIGLSIRGFSHTYYTGLTKNHVWLQAITFDMVHWEGVKGSNKFDSINRKATLNTESAPIKVDTDMLKHMTDKTCALGLRCESSGVNVDELLRLVTPKGTALDWGV